MHKTLSDSSPRVLVSQPWFLFQIRTRLPFAVSAFQLHRRLSLCFLPVSKLINGGIQSLRSFAQSACRQDLAGYASKKSSLFTATLYAATQFVSTALKFR